MRDRVWAGFLCVAIGALALGCADRTAAPQGEGEEELTALADRARSLREGLAGGPRPELQEEFRALVADVEAWQARTGRADIRVGTDTIPGPVSGETARDDDGGGPDDSCASCPGYTVEGDNICLLVEEGTCPDPDDEVFSGRICAYRCIWIGSGPAPAMGPEAAD